MSRYTDEVTQILSAGKAFAEDHIVRINGERCVITLDITYDSKAATLRVSAKDPENKVYEFQLENTDPGHWEDFASQSVDAVIDQREAEASLAAPKAV